MRALHAVVFLSVLFAVFAQDFEGMDRMPRTAPGNAWLVPYPRVGKRADVENHIPNNLDLQKRLYLARVGKRAYMYAARVGK